VSINNFIENSKNVSWSIFKDHSGKQNVDLLNQKNDSASLNDSKNTWKAFIFIGGSQFRCMFVASFSTITLLSLASERFSDVNESDYIKSVKDFMREYCNLLAGKIKASFETKTDAYLSLPIISREYDLDALFGTDQDKIAQSHWSIGENNMYIDINFYFLEKEAFDNYDKINENLQNNEENNVIDFF
jgi:hypothetical protein